MLRIFLFFIPVALFLFEYILFRYIAVFRESEALLLDSQIQWMLFATITVWCFCFIILRFKLDDVWLVGLLLIAIVMYFENYLSAFQPTKAIILLAGVTLGRGGAFLFNNRNSQGVFGHSFTFLQSSEIQRDLILILILLFSLTSWCHLDMTGSIYHGPRWMGLWDNPNIYGMLMGAGLTLAIGLRAGRKNVECRMKKQIRDSWNLSLRIFLLIAVGMITVGLFFSYSRGAWVGTAIGLLYLAKAHGKFKWRWILPGVLVAAAVVFIFWHSTTDMAPWYLKRLDFSQPSAQHRVAAWRGAVQMIRDHPLGVGWNQAVGIYDRHYLPPEGGAAAITMNSYLMLGTELGLPGLLCFVAYVALRFRSPMSKVQSPTEFGIQPVYRAGALVLLVAFWFDGGLFDLATASVFWILLELGTSHLAVNRTC
jgi:O-antigen ligase